MNEDLRYHMSNAKRATNVLKDLSRLAKEYGSKAKPLLLKQATAELFCYGSWVELESWIGTDPGTGPEDHELSPENLLSRSSRQIKAVMSLGFSEEIAEAMLVKLKPTGRQPGEHQINNHHRYANIGDYHPNRFLDMWSELFSPMGKFDEDLFDVEDELKEWAKDRPMLSHDKELCLRPGGDNETDIEYIFDVLDEAGFILDGSAIARQMSEPAISDGHCRNIPEPYRITYVHFGPNAFPSPYRDVGIEGAYVRFHFEDSATPETPADSIEVRVVCSLPFEAGSDWVDAGPMYYDELMSIRDHLRGVIFPVEGSGVNIMRSSLKYFRNCGVSSETYGGALVDWVDYLEAPSTAALNIIRGVIDKAFMIYDVPSTNMSEGSAKKFSRAATEKKFLAMAKDNQDRYPIVRFLGRKPPGENLKTEYVTPYANAEIEATQDYLHAFESDIQGFDPETMLVLLEKYRAVASADDASQTEAFTIHTLMRVIGYFDYRDSERFAELATLKERLEQHVHTYLGVRTRFGIERNTVLVWLAANILGLNDQTALAWDRLRNDYSLEKAVHLAPYISSFDREIANGDFAYVMEYFVCTPRDGGESAELRLVWDPFFVKSMIRTSE